MILGRIRSAFGARLAPTAARPVRRPPGLELLEPRLLFSGDAAGAALAEVAAGAAAAAQATTQAAPVHEAAAATNEAAATIQTAATQTTAAQTAATQAAATPHELVLVDSRVPGLADVLADLDAQRAAGRDLVVVTVDADTDGVSAITEALARDGGAPFDVVHLIGHGEPGALRLGDAVLDLDTLRTRTMEIAGWSDGLASDADLLLWGCDVAADADGRSLLAGLSALTGADVAASVDATGGLRAGGDWALEASVGAIEGSAPLGAALQAGYDGLLALAPTGGEVQVNTATTGTQQVSANGGGQVATSASGVTVAVWLDDNTNDILARRFDATGAPLGAPIVVSSSGNATDPAVAVDASGGFVVAWSRSGGNGVMARLYDASGTARGTEFSVDPGSGDSSEVTVAMNASGRFVVSWTEEDSGDHEVHARVFTSAGAAATGVLDVAGATTGNQGSSSVAIRDDGRFAVVYQSVELFGFGEGVYVRRYDTNGATLSPFLPMPVQLALGDQVSPDIAVDAAGDYVVVWADLDGSPAGIFGQRIAASDGSTIGSRFRADVSAVGVHTEPTVAALPGDGFVVAWQSTGQDGSGAGVYARSFLANGTPDSGEIPVNTTTAGDQLRPSVSGGAGRAFVVWGGASAGDAQGVVVRSFVTGTPGVTLSPVATTIGESGSPAGTVSVVLDAIPGAPVVVTLALDNPAAAQLSSTTLTFTPANWNVAQTVSVTGLDDGIAAGDRPIVVQASTASADVAFNGLADTAPGFLVVDDDGAPGVVISAAVTTLTEAGGTQIVSVVLASAPSQPVNIELAVSDAHEGVLSTTTVSFTAANWNIAQTVVLAGVDDTVIDGTRTVTVTALADSIGVDYSGVAATPLVFTNTDNDLRNQIVVDTDADLVDGDTSSLAALWHDRGADGRVSLREALLAAGATANGPAGADVVAFDLPGAGARTIALGAALPVITDTVEIDGTTDPDYAGRPVVQLKAASGSYDGLSIGAGADGSVVRGLSITGMSGVGLRIAASSVLVEANHIGLDGSGVVAAGNGGDGVRIEAGGDQVVRDNTISANAGHGIALLGADRVLISNNLIGVAVDGLSPRGNAGDGVSITAGAADNVITGNVISANAAKGIWIIGTGSDRNLVIGNAIGTDRSGTVALGNGAGGVVVRDDASFNRIGGVVPAEANLIMYNGRVGVQVADATGNARGNAILGNRIDGNDFGIDLTANPALTPVTTPNDPGDLDIGGNQLFNFPVLTEARLSADGTTLGVIGTVEGTPGEWIRIEVFADPTPDPSGYGQGPVLVGAFDRIVGTDGTASFAHAFAVAGLVASGHAVSATATRANATGTAWYDTSEFSAAVIVAQMPAITAPTAFTIPEGTTGPIQPSAVDADTPIAALVWAIVGGADAGAFAINPATGALRMLAAPDHEQPTDANLDGVYEVDVRVADPQGLADQRTISVGVLDVPEGLVPHAPASLGVVEDTPRTLSADDGTALSVTDADALGAPLAVELSVDRGTLSLAGTAGLSFAPGDGAVGASLRFSGSAADVGAALAGVVYTPPADANGAATLHFIVADAGDPMRSGSVQVAISIAAVDDAPVLVANGPQVALVGQRATLDAAQLRAVDVDDAAAAIVYTIEQLPADGALRLDGTPLAAGACFTQADLDAGRVSFDAPESAGTRTLVVSIADAAGQGDRGVSVTIHVLAGGAAPTTNTTATTTTPVAATAPVSTPVPAGTTRDDSERDDAPVTGPMVTGGDAASTRGAARSAPTGAVAAGEAPGEPAGAAASAGVQAPAPQRATESPSLAVAHLDAAGADPGGDRPRVPAPVPAPQTESAPAVFSLTAALRETAFRQELAQLREQLGERVAFDRNIVASTAAAAAGFSIGYVIWLMRGGVLLASLLASMPAWRAIDPLPVLGRLDARGRDADDEDDSLRGLLRDAAGASVGADSSSVSTAPGSAAASGALDPSAAPARGPLRAAAAPPTSGRPT